MLGGVVLREFLGECIFFTLLLAGGIDIVEGADAAHPEPFKGNRLGAGVPCFFGAEASHEAPDFADGGIDIAGDGGIVNLRGLGHVEGLEQGGSGDFSVGKMGNLEISQ